MKSKSNYQHLFLPLIISLVLLMIGSCRFNLPERTAFPSSTIYIVSLTSSEGLITKTAVSPLLQLTRTEIPVPSMGSTWTPIPTIRASQVDTFIDSLSLECELPCWGSIIPGQTSALEAKHTLSSFGTIIEETSIYFTYHQEPVVIDLTEKNEIVDSINLPPELTEAYVLNDLLLHYGPPEDIQMQVIPETAEGTPWFYLTVSYPQRGIFAFFSGEGKIIDSKVNACFEKVAPDLYLLDAAKYSSEEMHALLDPVLRNMLEPLESLTVMTQSQFYEVYGQPTDQCLATIVQGP